MKINLRSPAALRRALMGLGAAAALAAGALAATSGSTVEVLADGDLQEVRVASNATVADALESAEIEISQDDLVEPAVDTEVTDDQRVKVTRAITVDVIVDDESPVTVHAPITTVSGAVEAADLGELRSAGAAAVPSWHLPVTDGDTISVRRPVEVTLEVDGDEHTIVTLASQVQQLLSLQDVEVGPDDVVEPAPNSRLSDEQTITIQRVEFVEEVEEVVLEHDEARRNTSDLDRGSTRVEQEGRDGLRHDTYEVTYVDGEETERERIDREVVQEPRDRVVLVGTRSTAPASSSSGSSSSGSSSSSTSSSTPSGVPSASDPVWNRLAQCEANGNWQNVSANGMYYGGLQFHPDTWRSVGGQGMPHEASRAEQIHRAQLLLAKPWATWGNQWPACSRQLGLG